MYARMVTLQLGPGQLAATQKVANAQDPIIRALPGFHSLTWLHNETAGEYGSFSLWDTRDHATAVGGVGGLQLNEELREALIERPRVQIFEVAVAETTG